jgi:hypothetical protein
MCHFPVIGGVELYEFGKNVKNTEEIGERERIKEREVLRKNEGDGNNEDARGRRQKYRILIRRRAHVCSSFTSSCCPICLLVPHPSLSYTGITYKTLKRWESQLSTSHQDSEGFSLLGYDGV